MRNHLPRSAVLGQDCYVQLIRAGNQGVFVNRASREALLIQSFGTDPEAAVLHLLHMKRKRSKRA